jgi:hypothetical protein
VTIIGLLFDIVISPRLTCNEKFSAFCTAVK